MEMVNRIFELLSTSPTAADKTALEFLQAAKSQEERDGINWARGYALVELKRFDEALQIWTDIYDRTRSHKALHQIGYVHRSAGRLSDALMTFREEKLLVEADDTLAIAVNLYELSHCSLLLGDIEKSLEYFKDYEALNLSEEDFVERGCFFRLKGDIYRNRDKFIAKNAYEESLKFFRNAEDEVSTIEVMDLLMSLSE